MPSSDARAEDSPIEDTSKPFRANRRPGVRGQRFLEFRMGSARLPVAQQELAKQL